ncbi:Cerato-platanin [Peniophora sp. CONT]|nr:Cerato-platanin [Peniophora sp. CONT]
MQCVAVTLALVAAAVATDVRYDNTYDNADQSLGTVACSDGSNGLLTKGFTTFGSLPTFPNIGAAQAIPGYNSAACGSCWKITYGGETITVTAIDHAGDGFNIAEAALNTLTNGQAEHDGTISATAVEVDMSECGIPASA